MAQALVGAIEEPDTGKAEALIRGWFGIVVRNLCLALTAGRAQTYRVALWADTKTELTGLAYFGFESTSRVKVLDRDTSVAGHTLRTQEPYYVRDTEDDPVYRAKSPSRGHAYRSVYAQPLGRDESKWGVITVDAEETDGFTDVDKTIIAAFGKVVTAGASLWFVLTGEAD